MHEGWQLMITLPDVAMLSTEHLCTQPTGRLAAAALPLRWPCCLSHQGGMQAPALTKPVRQMLNSASCGYLLSAASYL